MQDIHQQYLRTPSGVIEVLLVVVVVVVVVKTKRRKDVFYYRVKVHIRQQ